MFTPYILFSLYAKRIPGARQRKGYPGKPLNKFADGEPIIRFQNTKSVTLTAAGKQKAEQLKKHHRKCNSKRPSCLET
jgi:hypothetical protein